MNKSYSLIWSDLTQAWVVVGERTKSRGKRSGGAVLTTISAALLCAGMGSGLAHAQLAANALPTGGNVAAGQASIATSGNRMDITQSSQRAVIDWTSFNIGSAAQVNFAQPSATAATLNRVLDSNPSQIFGKLTSNGQVFLTNPAGVVFAPGARVDVGSFTATTHSISNDDFMAARLRFSRDGATGSIVNAGEINAAAGGYVALLAPEVRNEGIITARLGTIALAAGEAYTLTIDGTALTSLQVEATTLRTLVDNRYALVAEDGRVILAARAADALQASVINQAGRIEATSLTRRGGEVILAGDDITVSGTIDTSGVGGGGNIFVGGGMQGAAIAGAPDLPRANRVNITDTAVLTADATYNGNGGQIIAWSEGTTTVAGHFSAQGGVAGGDGGLVETSGHQHLQVADSTRVNTLAPQGQAGQWLLDPNNFTIAAAGGDMTGATLATNLGTGDVTILSSSGGTAGSGDIVVNDNITANLATDRTLTLKAERDVVFQGGKAIDATGGTAKLNVTLWSDSDGTGGGAIAMYNGSQIKTNGGDLSMVGGTNFYRGYATGYSTRSNGIYLRNVTLDTAGGGLTLRGQSYAGAAYSDDGATMSQGIAINSNGGTTTITSGSGTMIMSGMAKGTGNSQGLEIGVGGAGTTKVYTTSGALQLMGLGTDNTANASWAQGINLQGANTQVYTGSGSLSLGAIGGKSTDTTNAVASGVFINGAQVMSQSGAIFVSGAAGSSSNATSYGFYFNAGKLGYGSSTVTASSSNISITADSASLGGAGAAIQSSGTLTWQNTYPTPGGTIGLGTGSGTLALPSSLFSGGARVVQDGFAELKFTARGGVNIGGTVAFTDPVTVSMFYGDGNIGIAAGATVSTSDGWLVLDTQRSTGTLINAAGPLALSGKWAVYLRKDTGTLGGLDATRYYGYTLNILPTSKLTGNSIAFVMGVAGSTPVPPPATMPTVLTNPTPPEFTPLPPTESFELPITPSQPDPSPSSGPKPTNLPTKNTPTSTQDPTPSQSTESNDDSTEKPEQPSTQASGKPAGTPVVLQPGQSAPAVTTSGIAVSLVRSSAAGEPGLVNVSIPRGTRVFSFGLPEQVMANASAAQLAGIKASLPDGSPLPSWLRFVPERRMFVANGVPVGALPVDVRVTLAGKSTLVTVSERKQ